MDEIISRRAAPWRAWLHHDHQPLLTLGPYGMRVEGHDLIAWTDLESVGEFVTEYGHGLGLRLADPLGWYAEHHGPWRDVISVMTMGRSPAQNVDMLGLRDPAKTVPPDRAARVEWARDQTGGWDLTIPHSAIDGGTAPAVARIEEFRARYA